MWAPFLLSIIKFYFFNMGGGYGRSTVFSEVYINISPFISQEPLIKSICMFSGCCRTFRSDSSFCRRSGASEDRWAAKDGWGIHWWSESTSVIISSFSVSCCWFCMSSAVVFLLIWNSLFDSFCFRMWSLSLTQISIISIRELV